MKTFTHVQINYAFDHRRGISRIVRDDLIRNYLHGSCLDIGCGEGDYLLESASRRNEATGLDLNIAYLRLAQTRLKNNGLNANLINSGVESVNIKSTFDLILCFHVLHMLSDPKEILYKSYDLLKDDGTFIAIVNSEHNPNKGLWEIKKNFWDTEVIGYYQPRFFKKKEIEELVRGAGFSNVVIKNNNGPLAVLLSRALNAPSKFFKRKTHHTTGKSAPPSYNHSSRWIQMLFILSLLLAQIAKIEQALKWEKGDEWIVIAKK